MDLRNPVSSHGRGGSFHVQVGEESRGTDFAGVVEAVGAYEGLGSRTIIVVLGGNEGEE